MTRTGERRQADEEIIVYCPDPEHVGDPARKMKMACYYGEMVEPFLQICRSCSQRGKVISDEQREKTSGTLKGRPKSDEFRQNLSEYMKTNPEGIARAKANLIPGAGGGWNKGSCLPEETRRKMSESHTGVKFTDEHCRHISEGRRKMLDAQGGFTQEHWENIWKANAIRRLQQESSHIDGQIRKERNRKRAKKHYDEKIATDTVTVPCIFCDEVHTVLRQTYDKNVARNGRYICGREGGHIAGSKPKESLRKVNPYADQGMKECARCHNVKQYDAFSPDLSRSDGLCSQCRECRAGVAMIRYHEKG
jgi:hypothetical protein